MDKMDRLPENGNGISTCKGLYKTGAIAALLAAAFFRRNLDAEWSLLRMTGILDRGPIEPPGAVADWFTLLRNDQLLGLTLLNFFDLVNYALVGLIFLALLAALWRTSQSWTLIAAGLGFVGISIYFASNQSLTMLALSKQYTAATTETQRVMFLTAGQALMAIHQNASYAGTGIYLSFLLVSLAGLIIAWLMRVSSIFSRKTAAIGILANGCGLGYYLMLIVAPAFVPIPLSISAIFLLIWYIQVGARLWALSKERSDSTLKTPTSRHPAAQYNNNVSQPG